MEDYLAAERGTMTTTEGCGPAGAREARTCGVASVEGGDVPRLRREAVANRGFSGRRRWEEAASLGKTLVASCDWQRSQVGWDVRSDRGCMPRSK